MATTATLTLLHTNDIHSHFDAWFRVVGRLRQERAAAGARGDQVLYVDAGDHQDRSAPEVEGTRGRVNLALLAAAGCAAATWGNGEMVGYGPGELAELAAAAAYPVLLGNLRYLEGGGPLAGAPDHTIADLGGLRVGLFGLTVPFNVLYEPRGLTCMPFAAAAGAAVAALRGAGCDLVVGLSHLGLRRDRELARAVPGIDVLVGAHSHHALDRPEVAGQTLVVQAGHKGSHLGRLRLEVERHPAGARVLAWDGGALPVDGAPPDQEAAAVLERFRADAAAALAREICVLPRPIPHDLEGPAPLVDQVAAELRRRLDADVALVNTGIFLDGFPAGPITREMLLARCPSLLNGVAISLPGREIGRALAQSRDPACIYYRIWAGARGKYVGPLRAAGQVRNLEPDRLYRVATLGLLALGFTGYDGLAGGQAVRWEMRFTLRDLVADLLQAEAGRPA